MVKQNQKYLFGFSEVNKLKTEYIANNLIVTFFS
jgi:hypothetical protein